MSQPPPVNSNIRVVPPPAASGEKPLEKMARRVKEGWTALQQSQLLQATRARMATFIDYALPPSYERLLLDGEKVLLEIRQAPYRVTLPGFVLRWWWLVLFLTAGPLVLLFYFISALILFPLALLLPLLILARAATERLHYEQWRLIITDKRTIIYMPDPDSWWRVDNVRMGGAKKIAVVDTNFSHSPWWGLFQTATGARDLVISISGYAFKANRAEVQGGLTFPDVMPQDVRKLEEIIFK